MPKWIRALAVAVSTALSALALTACAPSIQSVAVITTTNVWADIAQSIAGPNITVQPIISNPSQDPHSYEATPRDQLLISKAKLIIAACNDSDSFIKQLVKTETNLLCLDTNTEPGDNPHIWYNLQRTFNSAQLIRIELAKLWPEQDSAFTTNYQDFNDKLLELRSYLQDPGSTVTGAITNRSFTAIEPVANDLLLAMGLEDRTPTSVQQAGLNESDLSPTQLREFKTATATAGLYAFNSSQPSVQSDQINSWLQQQPKLPLAVGFSEQLPAGISYIQWMTTNAKNVYSALSGITID